MPGVFDLDYDLSVGLGPLHAQAGFDVGLSSRSSSPLGGGKYSGGGFLPGPTHVFNDARQLKASVLVGGLTTWAAVDNAVKLGSLSPGLSQALLVAGSVYFLAPYVAKYM